MTPHYDPRQAGCRCDECPLNGTSPVVPPEGNLTPKLVVVGDAPGPRDIEAGRPFFGAGGVKLSQYLASVRLTRADVWLTQAALCRFKVPDLTGGRAYNPKTYMAWLKRENLARRKAGAPTILDPFTCCAPRLGHEIARADVAARAAGAPNGVVVMPVENFAMGSVMGVPGKSLPVMKYRGSVIAEGDFPLMQKLLTRGK